MAINTFLKINGTPIQKMLKEYKVDYNLLRHNSSRTTETYIHNLRNSLPETYVRLKKQRIYNKYSIYWIHQDQFEEQR